MDHPISFSATDPGPRGVHITHPDRNSFLDEMDGRMRARLGFTVATLNVDHLVKLQSDATFAEAYAQHSHVVADGRPVVWLSKLAGRPVDLIPGSELVGALARIAGRIEAPVALLGSTEEVLGRAAAALERDYSGLKVVCSISPPFGFDPVGDSIPELAEQVAASGAALCFLALGAPKQEILAAHIASLAPNCGFISVGAGLDFVAGHQQRAPVWVQRIAMEWLWRLASNPRRLLWRYIACFAIMPQMMARALSARQLSA